MKQTVKLYVVLLLLSVPALLTICFPGLSGSSNIEHRNLQDMPKFPDKYSDIERWPQQFDQFTSDRFPFRGGLIRYFGEIFYQMGLSISPEVMMGSHDWLFLSNKNADVLDKSRGITVLSPAELDAWAEGYIRRRDYLLSHGIKLLFVFVPDKHAIYSEFLHPWNFAVGPTITDQIVQELGRRNVDGIVDLREILKEKARTDQVYGRYDTHWNDLGAYFAYQEIMKSIPDAHQVAREDLVFYKGERGELSRLIGYPGLKEESLMLDMKRSNLAYDHDKVPGARQYMREGWTSRTASPELPSALFLIDSFTEEFMYKYLAPSFNEALFMHHQGMQFDRELIERFSPNYVVYMIVERGVPTRPYWRAFDRGQ